MGMKKSCSRRTLGIDHYSRNGRYQVDNLFTKDRFLRRRLFAEMTLEIHGFLLRGFFTIKRVE